MLAANERAISWPRLLSPEKCRLADLKTDHNCLFINAVSVAKSAIRFVTRVPASC